MTSEQVIDSKQPAVLDLIGVGVGPFNLSLAALSESVEGMDCLFFDSKPAFNWHPGLLMDGCTLQVPFMADLVTMADPISRFTYLNYLHETGRLYNFYFHEEFLIPRQDYNRYCQWAATQLHSVVFHHSVVSVTIQDDLYCVDVLNNDNGEISRYFARNLVMGTGSVPSWPAGLEGGQDNPHCLHSAQYLSRKPELLNSRSITVVGAGQSAGEIIIDLLDAQEEYGFEINWLTRGDGFLPMEYSKLGLEHFSPEYIDYFHSLPEETRDRIRGGQDLWYKGMSDYTISEIYNRIYQRTLHGEPQPLTLQACSTLKSIQDQNSSLKLTFEHREQQQTFVVHSDKLVLSTGHRHPVPACLEPLLPRLARDNKQRLQVKRNYTVQPAAGEQLPGALFIQNGEIHSHGIGAPDLGLGAYRSAAIINELVGRSHYTLRKKNVFQNFGIADKWLSQPGTEADAL